MGQDAVFSGPLAGRFFRLRPGLVPGCSCRALAAEHAWSDGAGRGLPFYRSFCRGTSPYDGDLGEDTVDLAYSDCGSGIWRMWLREETRSVGRCVMEARAEVLALVEEPDTPLRSMQKSVRNIYLDRARAELLREAVPAVRVIPLVVMSSGWLWIGKRAAAQDRSFVHLLRCVVGDLELDPLLWTGAGWSNCSFAAVRAFCATRGGELTEDVVMTEVDVRGRSLRLRALDNADEVRVVLEQASSMSEAFVQSMSFDVSRDGGTVSIECDGDGLYRAVPQRSVGGLPHERVRRRFEDVLYAAGRVRAVLEGLVGESVETS